MEDYKKYPIITPDVIKAVRMSKPDDAEYENFKYYSDKKYPSKLIDENRPNEHDIVKEYRKKTYEPVFAEVFDRVLNSFCQAFQYKSDGLFSDCFNYFWRLKLFLQCFEIRTIKGINFGV